MTRLLPGSGAHEALQEGDLVLAVDGTPVNTFSALEKVRGKYSVVSSRCGQWSVVLVSAQ